MPAIRIVLDTHRRSTTTPRKKEKKCVLIKRLVVFRCCWSIARNFIRNNGKSAFSYVCKENWLPTINNLWKWIVRRKKNKTKQKNTHQRNEIVPRTYLCRFFLSFLFAGRSKLNRTKIRETIKILFVWHVFPFANGKLSVLLRFLFGIWSAHSTQQTEQNILLLWDATAYHVKVLNVKWLMHLK